MIQTKENHSFPSRAQNVQQNTDKARTSKLHTQNEEKPRPHFISNFSIFFRNFINPPLKILPPHSSLNCHSPSKVREASVHCDSGLPWHGSSCPCLSSLAVLSYPCRSNFSRVFPPSARGMPRRTGLRRRRFLPIVAFPSRTSGTCSHVAVLTLWILSRCSLGAIFSVHVSDPPKHLFVIVSMAFPICFHFPLTFQWVETARVGFFHARSHSRRGTLTLCCSTHVGSTCRFMAPSPLAAAAALVARPA